jgi:nucleotide-binding universal stress UspA family protein
MSTVIVITNLTDSSQHALEYACSLQQDAPGRIILFHFFSFSAGFAGEGASMAVLNDVYQQEEALVKPGIEKVKERFPGFEFETRVVAGDFEDALLEEIVLSEASLVITGAEGDYDEFLSWDNQVLKLFTNLPVPVIIVPAQIRFSRVQNLAFACNYRVDDPDGPAGILRKLRELWHCRIHLVYVNKDGRPATEAEKATQQSWQDALQRFDVLFHELNGADAARAVDSFCQEQLIDLLAIRPHRHGIWDNLFGMNNTREFAHLNSVPVLALRAGRNS